MIIVAVLWLIKTDRNIGINCVGKTRDDVLALLDVYCKIESSSQKRIKIGNSWGWKRYDNVGEIKNDQFMMSLPEWRVFESDVHFSLFTGWKYLVVKFNSEGIVTEQETHRYYDGP